MELNLRNIVAFTYSISLKKFVIFSEKFTFTNYCSVLRKLKLKSQLVLLYLYGKVNKVNSNNHL